MFTVNHPLNVRTVVHVAIEVTFGHIEDLPVITGATPIATSTSTLRTSPANCA
ncbi:MAG: hypothetical protein WKH97_12820 [Casimicrobiaceae bacterium]